MFVQSVLYFSYWEIRHEEESGMSAQEHTPQNQENDFIDFVKAAGVSSGIFFLIFIIAIVIDFVK
jgi:hypothetical protein